jgi:hypothetical protein
LGGAAALPACPNKGKCKITVEKMSTFVKISLLFNRAVTIGLVLVNYEKKTPAGHTAAVPDIPAFFNP